MFSHWYKPQRNQEKFNKAYQMRHNPTPAEARLWQILWREVFPNFPNYIFRRQWVAFGFILDFYCPALRMGLEVDGAAHDNREQYDRTRDYILAHRGITVYRVQNEDVLNNSAVVGAQIRKIIEDRTTPWQKKPTMWFRKPIPWYRRIFHV